MVTCDGMCYAAMTCDELLCAEPVLCCDESAGVLGMGAEHSF